MFCHLLQAWFTAHKGSHNMNLELTGRCSFRGQFPSIQCKKLIITAVPRAQSYKRFIEEIAFLTAALSGMGWLLYTRNMDSLTARGLQPPLLQQAVLPSTSLQTQPAYHMHMPPAREEDHSQRETTRAIPHPTLSLTLRRVRTLASTRIREPTQATLHTASCHTSARTSQHTLRRNHTCDRAAWARSRACAHCRPLPRRVSPRQTPPAHPQRRSLTCTYICTYR